MKGKFRQKTTQKLVQKTRKELRKEKRAQKKNKKHQYFQNRNKSNKNEVGNNNTNTVKYSPNISKLKTLTNTHNSQECDNSDEDFSRESSKVGSVLLDQQKEHEKESKLKLKMQKEMKAQRKKQLKEANREEDKVIKKLEKQLKMNKRKSKTIPKSFMDEGLDYLLEVCDSERIKNAPTELNLQESGSEFEDDFAIITGRKSVKSKSRTKVKQSDSDDDYVSNSDTEIFGENDTYGKHKLKNKEIKTKQNTFKVKTANNNNGEDIDEYESDISSDDEISLPKNKIKLSQSTGKQTKGKRKVTFAEEIMSSTENSSEEFDSESEKVGKLFKNKQQKSSKVESTGESDDDIETDSDFPEESDDGFDQSDDELSDRGNRKRKLCDSSEYKRSKKVKANESNEDSEVGEDEDGLWEDIYGRTRDKQGNVVQATTGKYIPPQLREKSQSSDSKRSEELNRLRKLMKGLINRLAENNMHSISNQIDELYMKNSRNDMNETLTELIFESLISSTLTSERLVMEHVMLVAILHANVGMEIGAHFLQVTIKKFDEMYNAVQDVENKKLDNVVLIISHLYNFKIFNAVLLYNILEKLSKKFSEKEVELILLVLRNVGFNLRKDDPLALKDLILRLQKKANESAELRNNTRVRFMLDILLAVKNNNMAKIPQYDPSYSEHLKKLIKTMIHKGKYLTELKITLEDLLKVEERGRWWIVGSAWTGNTNTTSVHTSAPVKTDEYSSAILELAHNQRMNTDTRKNIFCILMTAEDYMDAFEKLLRLGLKSGQEQEIVHVLIHCTMQEKEFNPYYVHLANQLCVTDRKHQLTIQYNVWDRLKELSDLSSSQVTNLAKFLAHLFLEKSLPISVLKVVQFSDMDKTCVKLMRQILLCVLLHSCEDTMAAVFTRVAKPSKLRMFRESLRLFLHHFVLKNVKNETEDALKLRERVKLAETALTSVDTNKLIL